MAHIDCRGKLETVGRPLSGVRMAEARDCPGRHHARVAARRGSATMNPQLYTYRFRNNTKRATMYGRKCEVLARSGRMNSCWIRFENGQEEIVSRNALRRVKG